MTFHWTPKKFTTEARFTVANILLDKLKENYQDTLVFVSIEGSTAKGLDAPESDLELRVLLDKEYDFHRWHAFFYNGMFVGISYNSLSRTLKETEVIDYEWSVAGDSIETAKVIYDPSNVYTQLKNQIKIAEQKANFKELAIAAITDMYEHIYKVFTMDDKSIIGVKKEVARIAYWGALTVGLANRFKYPSNKTMIEDSFHLESLPKLYQQNMSQLFLGEGLKEIKTAVSSLWESFLEWSNEELKIDLNDDQLIQI